MDNFCWGDPLRPELMWSLLEAARGCYESAVANHSPFISGKDSFNNEYLVKGGERQSIPASLLISSIATIPDVRRAVTLDFKQPNSVLYLAGDFQPSFGGSHYASCFGVPDGLPNQVPLPVLTSSSPVPGAFHPSGFTERESEQHPINVSPCLRVSVSPPPPVSASPHLYRSLHQAMQVPGLILACHDLSEGGLGVAAAEMCIASRLGLALELPAGSQPLAWLFGESAGCLLVEVTPGREKEFTELMSRVPCRQVGQVTSQPVFTVTSSNELLLSLTVPVLTDAWRTPLVKES